MVAANHFVIVIKYKSHYHLFDNLRFINPAKKIFKLLGCNWKLDRIVDRAALWYYVPSGHREHITKYLGLLNHYTPMDKEDCILGLDIPSW